MNTYADQIQIHQHIPLQTKPKVGVASIVTVERGLVFLRMEFRRFVFSQNGMQRPPAGVELRSTAARLLVPGLEQNCSALIGIAGSLCTGAVKPMLPRTAEIDRDTRPVRRSP